MTRLVIELAPGCFAKPTKGAEKAWNIYQRHCLSRPRDGAWEARRSELHRRLMEAFE
jgi:hypothetical protein